MKRGEVWIGASKVDFSGKSRAVVIIQNDDFGLIESRIVCPFTSDPVVRPYMRLEIIRSEENGLEDNSCLMVDKIGAMPIRGLTQRIGALSNADLLRLEQGIAMLLRPGK
jgi:mRNA interferase MazF